MTIRPERPQSIGGVLDSAIQLYKASVLKVWLTCLFIAIATALPMLYLLASGSGPGNAADPLGMVTAIMSPGYWIVYLISLVLTMWLWGALYIQVGGIGMGEDPGAAESLKAAVGRTLPLVLMTILFVIALMVGLVLLVIPGLILMVSLMLGANLVIFERKGPVDALTGSHNLVWGNWWRTCAILIVGFIILMVVYMCVGFVTGLLTPVLGGDGEDLLFNLQLTSLITTALLTFLVMPFYVALLVAVYWDLKLRKEGGDLAARVTALGAA